MQVKKECSSWCDFIITFDETIRRFRISPNHRGYFADHKQKTSSAICSKLRK